MKLPVLATWLLRHFASTRMNDALTGDLTEELQSGRSRLWFWRQVLVATLVGLSKDIWSHKLLALRALAVGWLFIRAGWVVAVTALVAIPRPARFWVAAFFVAAAAGWVVARLHRPHHGAMTFVFMGFEIANMTVGGILYPAAYRAFKYDSLSFERAVELQFELFIGTHFFVIFAGVVGGIMVGALLAFPRRSKLEPTERVVSLAP